MNTPPEQVSGDYLAQLGHELRTPLNGMLGLTWVLAQTPLSPEQKELVEALKHSGDQLLRTVNDVLDLAQLEAGALPLQPGNFAPLEAVEEVLATHRFAALSRQVELKALPSAQTPSMVTADPARFRQILSQLLAAKLKLASRETVTVKTRWAEGILCTQITGGGPLPSLPPLSLKLAALMGGSLAEDATGGLSFSVAAGSAAGPVPGSVAPGRMALVVDDEEDNRFILRRMLERLGYAVEEAGDGESALARLGERAFDVVFLDGEMPRLDGFATARRIRENLGDSSRIRLVGVTANPFQGADCLAAGMDAFLAKPLPFARLAEALDELFADS